MIRVTLGAPGGFDARSLTGKVDLSKLSYLTVLRSRPLSTSPQSLTLKISSSCRQEPVIPTWLSFPYAGLGCALSGVKYPRCAERGVEQWVLLRRPFILRYELAPKGGSIKEEVSRVGGFNIRASDAMISLVVRSSFFGSSTTVSGQST